MSVKLAQMLTVVSVTFKLLLVSAASTAEPALMDLTLTGWRLERIVSMDDSILKAPADSAYSLVFDAEGYARIDADCNRVKLPLTAFDPPQIQLGPPDVALEDCDSASLHRELIEQLAWVRSYIWAGGKLHLATMADGSIIEFSPLLPADATVLGLSLFTDNPDALRSVALTRMLQVYAQEYGIAATESEVDAYVANQARHMREDLGEDYRDPSSLPVEERRELERAQRFVASAMISQWKINKQLYEEYGGRVIYQQLGPEPLDAYREFLSEAQEAGRLSLNNAALTDAFWQFFDDPQRHDFIPAGSDELANVYKVPPWAAP